MGKDIVPSFMEYEDYSPSVSSMFSNWRLRVGEIQERIPPTDARNVSKKVDEYRVSVQHMEGGTQVTRIYDYCVLSNMFGSISDNLKYTLRADPSASRKDSQKNSGAGKGAKVLLLCVNGNPQNAVIIGGIHDSKDVNDKAEGHHLDFVFNGVAAHINNDGELTLEVHGKTDQDGKTSDEVGSVVKIDKSGNISVTSKGEVNIDCGNAVIKSDQIELGGDGLAIDPQNGVVLGSWVEPITGSPVWSLGGTSLVVSAKKMKG